MSSTASIIFLMRLNSLCWELVSQKHNFLHCKPTFALVELKSIFLNLLKYPDQSLLICSCIYSPGYLCHLHKLRHLRVLLLYVPLPCEMSQMLRLFQKEVSAEQYLPNFVLKLQCLVLLSFSFNLVKHWVLWSIWCHFIGYFFMFRYLVMLLFDFVVQSFWIHEYSFSQLIRTTNVSLRSVSSTMFTDGLFFSSSPFKKHCLAK